ncbi:hypothetical protein NC661_03740 [Aquibacillus koreensis]|uniref:Uncharacterized protein n=1 Tax=Aquibacillus koreensis TaxID=279446 RepID=A0A9X3WIB1_9BACI|nr:hypothetical protein [Aquibacillus koreensis]MCT2536438.1 hypothetical protein [Aquibacillus koreensis]MDC3419473.1 hypothetical protein [Aquibacillus koreensis]
MKQSKVKWTKSVGWLLFLMAIGFFCLQIGYLIIQPRYQVEYIDNRIFYVINMLSIICLYMALLFLLTWKKIWTVVVTTMVTLFIIVNVVLLVERNKEVKNISSISPNLQQIFAIKQDTETGEAMYYRSYYGILSRPKDRLEPEIAGDYKIEWLANDIAAFTYEAEDQTIQQFIGTYGDRQEDSMSYYYVASQIRGKWGADNAQVERQNNGIAITVDDQTELFGWDNVEQFGTLAIVLKKNNEAVWAISLDENFVANSEEIEPTVGNISLYKATMEENDPIVLAYQGGAF